MAFVKQNLAHIWAQLNGKNTAFTPVGVGTTQIDDTEIENAGQTPVYGSGRYGQPVLLTTNDDAPGSLPTTTVTLFEQGVLDYFSKQATRFEKFSLQRRFNGAGVAVDNPNLWQKVNHFGRVRVASDTIPGSGNIPYAGDVTQTPKSLEAEYALTIVAGELSAVTSNTTEDINTIFGLSEPADVPGYRGIDKVLYYGADADEGGVSTDGGATWTALATAPVGNASNHLVAGGMAIINSTQLRVVYLIDDSTLEYKDFTFGLENASGAFTQVAALGTAGEAFLWNGHTFDRMYAACDGDIYVSTNYGVSFAAATYTGSNAINGFTLIKNAEKHWVYAFGASNTLLREVNGSGTFAALTGPTGSNASGALAVANDGRLYLGNGTGLWVSENPAPAATTEWTQLQDFGSAHAVTSIRCVGGERARGGDGEVLIIGVDDSTPGTGSTFVSLDGGNTTRLITEVSNTGYNTAFFSDIDDNLAFFAGDGGTVLKYAPA